MELLGKSSNRNIYYLPIDNAINVSDLPTESWVAYIFSNKEDKKLFSDIAKKCVDNNVLQVESAGKEKDTLHFIFDKEIVSRQINKISVDDNICTNSHDDFDEGLWFTINLAWHPYKNADKVVCIDIGMQMKEKIIHLINAINNGWLPKD